MSLPNANRGQPITAQMWNRLVSEVNRNRLILGPGAGIQGLQTTAGVSIQAAGGSGSNVTYIRLTGPAGPDGGYPWEEVTQAPPIEVTEVGTGTPTAASLSGGGWTGWTLGVTAASGGGLASVYFTGSAGTTGTPNVLPTITITGGTGCTAAITDAQDVTSPYQWLTTGTTGDLTNAAYEARGCFGLPNDGTVYPAITGPGGKLLFFCNPVQVGETYDNGSYPTTYNATFAIAPLTVGGTQTEGAFASFAGGPSGGGTYPVFYATNLGVGLPLPGTKVICRWTGTRWAFRYDVNVAGLLVSPHETPSTSLKIDMAAGYAANSSLSTLTQVAAVSGFTLSSSATNYVYLDASYALTKSTSGWPGGHHTKLAVVVTGSSAITSFQTDPRTFVVAAQQT